MTEINVRDARRHFKDVLDRVERGEKVTLLRRGKPVARLLPPEPEPKVLPDLSAFRASIEVRGRPLSEEVIAARREARY